MMLRFALASALLLGAISAAGTPWSSVVGKSFAPAPQSREQAAAGIDDATAAALIGAISSQFGERQVQVRLAKVDIEPAGFAQRDLQGSGQLRIGRGDWIPIRFRSLYDTEQAHAGNPELTLGTTTPDQPLPRSGRLVTSLVSELVHRLHTEFPQQVATVRLGNVRSAPIGEAYLRIEATGTVAFGADGTTATRVSGLYDPRRAQWLRVAYHLGNEITAPLLAKR